MHMRLHPIPGAVQVLATATKKVKGPRFNSLLQCAKSQHSSDLTFGVMQGTDRQMDQTNYYNHDKLISIYNKGTVVWEIFVVKKIRVTIFRELNFRFRGHP